MSKFCESCGSELKDTDNVCPNCGATVVKATKKEDVKKPNTNSTNSKLNNANSTKLYALIGGIAAIVVLIIIILAMAFSGGYKKPIDNMFKGMEKGNAKIMLKAFPDVMKEDLEDQLDNKTMNKLKESLEDEYGKNIKITYKILDKEKIDKDDLEDVQEKLEDKYDDAKKSKVKVTAGYKVTVKATIKGKDDKDSDTQTLNVYKIGGKWCLSSPSSIF